MLLLLAQIELNDRADLACQGASFARDLALYIGVGALLMVAFAYFYRNRAAEDGLHTVWAISSLLLAALHVIAALAFVPQGCLTQNEFTFVVATATPWMLAAGLFRAGLAPVPPPIVTRDDARDEPPGPGGDHFA